MLAIVRSANSVRASLKYNEQKVDSKQARLLDAHNFWQGKNELSMHDKLQRFNDLSTLNERSKKHSVHLTLNFSPKDDLSDQQMKRIATDFMGRIGFAEQPWLTYRHVDAGHPHMHIVSTNIRPDGSRISNDLRSPAHLKQVCFEMEQLHRLTPAIEMPDLFKEQRPTPAKKHAYEGEQRITYGEAPTKTEIARVLDHVVHKYAFADLESYNALLSTYRVRAERGREDSPTFKNKGLYYRVIDEEGKKLGAPIKASAFPQPVKLHQLETTFQLNRKKLEQESDYMRIRIDNCIHFVGDPCSLGTFKNHLMQKDIDIVVDPCFRANRRVSPHPQAFRDGHGFFYIDHHAKTAIRDTDLGPQYSAAAVLERTGIERDIRRLAKDNRFQLTLGEQRMLSQPDYRDRAETLGLLLKMSDSHDRIVEHKLELQQQQELGQRHGRGLGLSG